MSDLQPKQESSQLDTSTTASSVTPSLGGSAGLPHGGNATEGEGDGDDSKSANKRERRKIEIKFIQEKSRRHITFSKRKAGIMKKAYELSVLTGTQVLLLVVSETGLVYTFTTPKLQPLVTRPEGKNLIQACLNAPEETSADDEDAQTTAPQQQGAPQQVPGAAEQAPHSQSQLPPPPPHQGQYGVPPQMAGGYLNPGDQSNYYMGFSGNQGYN